MQSNFRSVPSRFRVVAGLFLVMSGAISAHAQQAPSDGPLVSDRPDFTESAVAVPAGRVQIEAGYTYTQESSQGSTTREHVAPELLARVGLQDGIEMRIAWAGAEIEDSGGRVSEGAADLSLGAKIDLYQSDSLQLAMIVESGLPTGSENRSADRAEPGAKGLWGYNFESFSLSGNLNYASRVLDGDRYNEWAGSLAVGFPLAEKLGMYTEFFGIYPDGAAEARAESYVNGGFTYSVHDDLQLDIRAGTGLNENAADLFAGSGFVYRF